MELYFKTTGKEDGKPLVILHGLYGCSDNWFSIGRELGTLHNVFLVDLRNHGNSFHSTIHDYNSMTNDLNDLIQSRICEKITLIGHSMGGKVAMNFALKYPEKTEKLIVVDIAPKSYLDFKKFSTQINMHKAIIDAIQNTNLEKFTARDDIEKAFVKIIDSEKIRKLMHKNIRRSRNRFYWKLNIEAIASNFNKILDNIDLNRIKSVPVPTLFLRGEHSKYILDSDRNDISALFPDHRIETIPGSGHWIHVEQPFYLIEKLKDFLKIPN